MSPRSRRPAVCSWLGWTGASAVWCRPIPVCAVIEVPALGGSLPAAPPCATRSPARRRIGTGGRANAWAGTDSAPTAASPTTLRAAASPHRRSAF